MTGTSAGSTAVPGLRRVFAKTGASPARWVLALAVFGAIMGASIGLHNVFLENSWFPQAALVTAITVLLPAIARGYRGLVPFAPIAALLGWFMGLTLAFFPGTAYLGVIPSTQTIDAAVSLAGEAAASILIGSTPMPADDGLRFVICAGLGFAALLVDTLAVTVAMPAASALALVLLLLPAALTTEDGIGTAGLIGSGLGYLLILGCCRWYAPGGQLRHGANRAASGTLARATGLGAVVVLAMTLLPAVIPGFTSGTFPQGSKLGSPGNVAGLNPMISLGNDLRAQSGAVNMTYLTSASEPLYLRLSTLEDFSGNIWKPSPFPTDLNQSLVDLSPAFGPSSIVPQAETVTLVSVINLSSNWLPTPLSAFTVDSARGLWSWNPSTQTIHGNDTTKNQSYTVSSLLPVLTPELLQTATQQPAEGLDPIFSALPNNMPAIIKKTADQVAGSKSTPYEKAIALQDYFRSSAFTYSVKTPVEKGFDGTGMNVLAKFLDVKSGYCIHFSAAMAVMARELGIPSRVVVGYAPGQPTSESGEIDGYSLKGYQVTGRDAHAWPELYFEGIGWVPFEPTPSRGVVPAYAQDQSMSTSTSSTKDFLNGASAQPSSAATATPTTATATTTAAPVAAPTTSKPARVGSTVLAIALVLFALASPAFTRVLVRRRRLSLVRTPATGGGGLRGDPRDAPQAIAWREMRATALDYGYRFDPALTPAQQAEKMARLVGDGPSQDVDLVRSSYEQLVYGPPGQGANAGSREDLALALERFTARVGSRATPAARLRAVVLPPSLFKSSKSGRA